MFQVVGYNNKTNEVQKMERNHTDASTYSEVNVPIFVQRLCFDAI
jgi:hypothetical protein